MVPWRNAPISRLALKDIEVDVMRLRENEGLPEVGIDSNSGH